MNLRVVDAFTDKPFGGNPAAVCVLDAPANIEVLDASEAVTLTAIVEWLLTIAK